jgi:hypothetical protein
MRPTSELFSNIRESIDQLWAEGISKDQRVLLKKLVTSLTPTPDSPDLLTDPKAQLEWLRQQRKSFLDLSLIKTIHIHAHMDEDNLDLARLSMCGDLVPEEDGTLRPACSYNLLYRAQDPRFFVEQNHD